MPFITKFSPLLRRAGAAFRFRDLQHPSRTPAFSTTARTLAQKNSTSQVISETAKAEGGPSAGSTSAQMQSQVGRQQNFEQAAEKVGAKMQNDPASVTEEDANYLKSREARATGQAQPPKDSISAEAQRLASANEQGISTASSTGPLAPEEQSVLTKQKNFQEAATAMAEKMENDPESVTKRDGDLMHRREQRALGQTEKGGIASQAQKLAAENEK